MLAIANNNTKNSVKKTKASTQFKILNFKTDKQYPQETSSYVHIAVRITIKTNTKKCRIIKNILKLTVKNTTKASENIQAKKVGGFNIVREITKGELVLIVRPYLVF